jgi:tRNA threonylcarbamoyladenosine biosynthesis protein TsaB
VRVLAVDTTTPRGSVAVAAEDGVLAEARVRTADGHSRWVLGAIEALLGGLSVEPAALDGFAVTVGPGSFTGLRVGLATVQGLAIASGRRCVGLPTLDVLASSVAGAARRTVALMEAFRGEVFWGVYDADSRPIAPPRVGPLEEALAAAAAGTGTSPTAFVGDAVAPRRTAIEAARPNSVFPEAELFLAAPLARAARLLLAGGGGVPGSLLRPLYLRGADIRPPRT